MRCAKCGHALAEGAVVKVGVDNCPACGNPFHPHPNPDELDAASSQMSHASSDVTLADPDAAGDDVAAEVAALSTAVALLVKDYETLLARVNAINEGELVGRLEELGARVAGLERLAGEPVPGDDPSAESAGGAEPDELDADPAPTG